MSKQVDIETASLMWEEGKTVDEISKALGISKDRFLRIRNEMPQEFATRRSSYQTTIIPAKYQKAKQLWSEKYSIRAIASIISVTPSAMAGMMGRNRDDFPARTEGGMKRHYSARSLALAPKKTVAEAAQERQARLSANAVRKMFHEALNPLPAQKPKEKWEAYDKSRMPGVSLVDLDAKRCCRWPITEHPKGIINLFCGEIKAGKNYCREHHARSVRMI